MDVEKYFADYTEFTNSVLAEISGNDELFKQRLDKLSKQLGGKFAKLDNAISGLNAESGEVADLWKKVKFHYLDYSPETKDKFIKELGDVCWYLFQTADALQISVKDIINANIAKLQQRHNHGFSAEYLQKKDD